MARRMNAEEHARRVRLSSFGWMVQEVSHQSQQRLTAELKKLGLSLPHFPVLMVALEHGPLSQAEIGRYYHRPAYVISRALDGLEERGLIERRPHPNSRRAHAVHVTEAGNQLAERLYDAVGLVNDLNLAPLSDQERETLVGLLARLLPRTG
ncbi:MarR family winged helix-turn-helix transcriptional regulator [Shimia abyssi]|uniref:DNA-binding MarR family transcriptional regulator n=1 Tax=Shimia abyssi TaxID=1662395 RepID=A0A2P8FHJ9_9RHOB|nr:MarR family transcriptional regulator [Shimia abyssi]PSL21166.1 DNA-binding MarR family transcriptional regulator [Shimia abyssi]